MFKRTRSNIISFRYTQIATQIVSVHMGSHTRVTVYTWKVLNESVCAYGKPQKCLNEWWVYENCAAQLDCSLPVDARCSNPMLKHDAHTMLTRCSNPKKEHVQ